MNLKTPSPLLLAALLTGLVGWSFGFAWLSDAFSYDRDVADTPVFAFVALQISAGVLYLVLLWCLRHTPSTRGLLLCVFAVGLMMRVSQLSRAYSFK